MGCLSELRSGDVGGDMDEVNVFNPDLKNCEERYDDLCDYFNNDPETIKTILWDRKAFKAWLERAKWHVLECDRLGREVDRLTKELDKAQPKAYWIMRVYDNSVIPNLKHVIECSNCHVMFSLHDLTHTSYCPNCGAKMMSVR